MRTRMRRTKTIQGVDKFQTSDERLDTRAAQMRAKHAPTRMLMTGLAEYCVTGLV